MESQAHVLVVANLPEEEARLESRLRKAGLRVALARDGASAARAAARPRCEVLVADEALGELALRRLLSAVGAQHLKPAVILIAADGSARAVEAARRHGVYDVLPRGHGAAELVLAVQRAAEKYRLLSALLHSIDARRRQEFAADELVHEIVNPLGSITMFFDYRVSGALGEAAAPLKRSLESLLHWLQDFIECRRLRRRKVRLQWGTIDAAAEIAFLVELHGPKAESLGIKLSAELPPGALPLRADAQRLRQVLNNLIVNAMKFTPRGGSVVVTAEADPDEPLARLGVEDTGVGIPDEELKRIFDRFAQVDGATGGLGLGLAICRELVALHGGQLTAANRPYGGCRFEFTMPRAAPDAIPAAPAAS